MPQQPQSRTPAVGEDVTALMPKVGEDVTALMEGADKPKPVPLRDQQIQAAKDMGIGAAKSTGRNVLDLAKLAASMNPVNIGMMAAGVPEKYRMGYTPPQVDQMLTETNRAQNVGGRAADVLSAVIPAGMAMRGARAARGAATVAAEAMPKGNLAVMTPESVADYLGSLPRVTKPAMTEAATAAAATPAASLGGARKMLTQGMLDAAKYGAGGAVANAIRRLLIGGQ